ncbi:hypothetical protein L9F63_002943 [Diploptera punctata]|uniref:CHK kinase-like domain-containing protein n=1 Tax=Diploptera punctata TaxID=6984 RepID=A0AAD7ZR94_DIPPU|nr:hypothetical protein L9F63_002943 [Diploptera punctata]
MATMDAPWMKKSNLEEWLKTPVLEVMLKDAQLNGDNYLSSMYRMRVKTKQGEKALIVKCRLQNTDAADAFEETSIFKKEAEMYWNTLPKLEKLLTLANQGEIEPLAPQCIYSCKDFLVMEDLSVDGYKMLERYQGLNLEQCLTVMRTLARFHAASVVLHEQDPQSMEEYDLSFFVETSLLQGWTTYFQGMINMLIEEMESWPAAQWKPYIEKLRHVQKDFMERLLQCVHRDNSDFNVLIHGDLWTNNILFRGDAARFIDFQLVHYSSPALDLRLFLATSPNMDVRINHSDRLIQEYHSILCSTLTALGSKKFITLEELYQMYRDKGFYGIFGIASEAAVMTAHPNCGFNLDEAIKGRTPGPQMYSDFFRDIVKLEFPILDKIGAFH